MTNSATGASRPVSGRSSGTQYGLGRKRMSKTTSASSGQAVLEPERHHGDAQLHPPVAGEERGQLGGQLVDVEARAVDDDVGARAQVEEQRALALDAVEQAAVDPAAGAGGGRSRSGARAPRPSRRGRRGSGARPWLAAAAMASASMREPAARPHVDDDGDLLRRARGCAAGPRRAARRGPEQLGRQVVDDEPARGPRGRWRPSSGRRRSCR